jgi:integral membrane protein
VASVTRCGTAAAASAGIRILVDMTARTFFRVVAIGEALSWAGLLIGMLVKYVITDGANETGVHVFGPIHGAMFVIYVLTVLALFRHFGWSWFVTLVALGASIPPFATLVFEIWADRTGRLDGRDAATGTGSDPLAASAP